VKCSENLAEHHRKRYYRLLIEGVVNKLSRCACATIEFFVFKLCVGILPTMKVKEEQEREGVTPEMLEIMHEVPIPTRISLTDYISHAFLATH